LNGEYIKPSFSTNRHYVKFIQISKQLGVWQEVWKNMVSVKVRRIPEHCFIGKINGMQETLFGVYFY